jgi:NAD(P)-dependent dehydrogenase (short-subunit alcohol dehydrogenase family)
VTIEEGKRLAGDVAVVMGAGAVGPGWGNGRAIAVLFARHGAKVLVVDKDRSSAEETAQIIRAEGNSCEVAVADATDVESVAAAFSLCAERLGQPTSLVNNVGGSIPGGPLEMTIEEFNAQLSVNLTSAFVASKVSIPYFQRGGRGSIVNVGSVGGSRHLGHHHVGYSAGKAGLVQFTRQLAVQYGKENIRCNTVIPGLIDTPLLEHRVAKQKGRLTLDALREEAKHRVPLGRRGEGWDVAYAALFLTSSEAKYVSGTEILVDGGLLARGA